MKREFSRVIRGVVASGGLSPQARTRSGVQFDATADVWTYRDDTKTIRLDFHKFQALSPDLILGAKRTFQMMAEKGSPSSLNSYFYALIDFVRYLKKEKGLQICIFTGVNFLNYRATKLGGNYAAHLRTLLRSWHRLGAVGISPELLTIFDSTTQKGKPKGVAVATLDPFQGPLTDVELQGLQDALNTGYADAAIEIDSFVLAWLFMSLGSRPVQFAALKVKDVHAKDVARNNFPVPVKIRVGR